MNLVSEIWNILTPRQRRWVVGAQVLSITMGFSTVAGIASIAPFFSVLGNPQLIEHNSVLHTLYLHGGFSNNRSFIIALGFAFMGLVLLANVINLVGSFVMIRLAHWIGSDLQSILFEEYLHRPYVFHARTQSAVLLNNIIQEATRATTQILQNSLSLIANGVTSLFIVITVVVLNPAIAAGMVAALAGGYVLIYLLIRNRLLRAGQVQSRLFIQLIKTVNESLGAIKDILVLRTQNFFRDQFTRSSREFARAAAHTLLIGQSPRYVMESVAVAGLVSIALFAGSGADGIGPSLGQLTFLGFAAYRLLPILQQVFASVVRIRADRPGFTSIAADLRLARSHERYRPIATDPAWQAAPRSEIRLQGVVFRYEADRAPAVAGVSLSIPARASIGIVGANGSGKTTLVDLVAGLLVPSEGRIEVDGTPLTDENRPSWQTRIAYVPQSIALLDATVAQNVALGVCEKAINRERLLMAAQLAQVDEFVKVLPGGYDHVIGERGTRLSGGQRQRIGIARALYADASVLILDEATNALDGLTEQELMATMSRLRGRYTIILIAHRLATVRACDAIFELTHGKLAASGTYDDLLRSSETFRRMVNIA
jgi:ABC-type multidrug transport system fused ATPase/permease subunit